MTDQTEAARIAAGEYLVEVIEDRPLSGMWHCGPNATWVTVTHLPTMISARAFDTRHHEAKRAAQACCEMMVEQSRLLRCQFPKRLATLITALEARVKELDKTLRWYGEQARLCRLIHSEGDEGRNNLSEDGGKKAAAALAKHGERND